MAKTFTCSHVRLCEAFPLPRDLAGSRQGAMPAGRDAEERA
ncbi:hypothetical protein [Nonomuraea insulae]|uniref:Uncharacterized protein n=1 Tax=Nonomuraea insulae TaxID=1616787 RepID=A0ABW1DDA8_9ACTN